MAGESLFTVTVDNEEISVDMEEARAICPDEVRAMESAWRKTVGITEDDDKDEIARAALEVKRRMEQVLHCLSEAARRELASSGISPFHSLTGGSKMTKSPEQATRRLARGSLMTFFDGDKELPWVLGEIKTPGVRGPRLQEVFDSLKDYGKSDRLQEAYAACQTRGWLE